MNAAPLFFLAMGSLALALPAAAETRPLIQVTVELIEVQSAEATRLLTKEKLGTDGVKLRAELETLITQGKAAVFETMLVTTISGQKVEGQSVREVIYPTEYEPPELPGTFGASTPESRAAQRAAERAAKKKERIYPPVPTAFDTRNTGGTLQIEPVLTSNNSLIEQRVEWEMVCEAGQGKWGPFNGISGLDLTVTMPFFYNLNIKTPVISGDGVPALLSVLTPTSKKGPTDPTRKLLVLITADVVTATPSAK